MNAENRGWGPGWPDCQYHRWVPIPEITGSVHEDAAAIFQALIADLAAARGEDFRRDWSWGAACRPVRGTDDTPSNHSWALACDLDAPVNGMGWFDDLWSNTTMPRNAGQIAGKYGCRWGGDYWGRKDPMHFEFMGTPAQARRITARLGDISTRPAWRCADPDGVLELWEKDCRGHTAVTAVQRGLHAHWGFPDLAVDGFYGPNTSDAVEAFQDRHSGVLVVDGLAGPRTIPAILHGRFPDPRDDTPTPPVFPLPDGHWYGPESPDGRNHSGYWPRDRSGVARLQRRLRTRGWRLTVDGVYGPRTTEVVEAFQRQKRIHPIDGLTGAVTWPRFWTEPVT